VNKKRKGRRREDKLQSPSEKDDITNATPSVEGDRKSFNRDGGTVVITKGKKELVKYAKM